MNIEHKATIIGLVNQYGFGTILYTLIELIRERANDRAQDGRFAAETYWKTTANKLEKVYSIQNLDMMHDDDRKE